MTDFLAQTADMTLPQAVVISAMLLAIAIFLTRGGK